MKEPISARLDALTHMLNNKEMANWASKFDAKGHGAKAAATHLRVNLSAIMKEAKAIRVEIQERRVKL